MEKFKPEFGNKEHIDLINQEAAKQALVEIYEEYGDYVCSYDRVLVLKDEILSIVNSFYDLYDNLVKDFSHTDPRIIALDRAVGKLRDLSNFNVHEE